MDILVNQHSVNETTLQGVVKYIFRHPLRTIVSDWHWKAALFSALFRTPVFLIAYHKQGLSIALAAGLVQFIFRTLFGGVGGSLIQKFSRVKPAWHAAITIPIFLTVISHIIEYIIQVVFDNYHGTNLAEKAIIASVTISAMSAVFNLFVMRRGVLLVKDDNQKSLKSDFASIPLLLFDFIMTPSRNIYKRLTQKQFFMAVLVAFMQSLGTGIIAAVLRRKVEWGYWTAGIVFGLTVIAVSIIALSANGREKKIEVVGEYQPD